MWGVLRSCATLKGPLNESTASLPEQVTRAGLLNSPLKWLMAGECVEWWHTLTHIEDCCMLPWTLLMWAAAAQCSAVQLHTWKFSLCALLCHRCPPPLPWVDGVCSLQRHVHAVCVCVVSSMITGARLRLAAGLMMMSSSCTLYLVHFTNMATSLVS